MKCRRLEYVEVNATGAESSAVAEWAHNLLKSRNDAEFELSTSRITNCRSSMSLCPHNASVRQSAHEELGVTKCSLDAYVFRHPRNNHATRRPLKNAIDFLYQNGINKAAGLSDMAVRAVCELVET